MPNAEIEDIKKKEDSHVTWTVFTWAIVVFTVVIGWLFIINAQTQAKADNAIAEENNINVQIGQINTKLDLILRTFQGGTPLNIKTNTYINRSKDNSLTLAIEDLERSLSQGPKMNDQIPAVPAPESVPAPAAPIQPAVETPAVQPDVHPQNPEPVRTGGVPRVSA